MRDIGSTLCARDTIVEELRQLLSRQSGVPAEQIANDQPFGQVEGGLDLDSLDRIELAIIVGRRAHIDIPDAHVDWPELGTLEGLARYVEARNLGLVPTRENGGPVIYAPRAGE